jgi:hypothetical protein
LDAKRPPLSQLLTVHFESIRQKVSETRWFKIASVLVRAGGTRMDCWKARKFQSIPCCTACYSCPRIIDAANVLAESLSGSIPTSWMT